MYLFGWTCDWAAPTTSSTRPGSGYQDGKPNLQFGWKNDAANALMLKALQEPTVDAATPTGASSRRPHDRHAAVPIVNSTPTRIHDHQGPRLRGRQQRD